MSDLMKVEHNVRVLQEAKSLKKAGYDVLIVGFSNTTKERNLTIEGINVVSFYLNDSRKGIGKACRSLTAIIMILRVNLLILSYKADIYHAHNFHVLAASYLSSLIHRGRLIYDTHESWTIHRAKKFHPEHIFAFIIEKFFLRNLLGFVTVNEMVAQYYANLYGINRAVILYNSRPIVPLTRKNLIREELRLKDETKIALFIGGFWPSGRPLLEIIESGKYLSDNVAIVLIGYGSKSFVQKMIDTIKNNNLEKKVFIMPPKTPGEVMNYVMSADIGLNLIKREGRAQDFQSPWKLFEYCMGGLAIVSTDLPFHKKVYTKHEIGLLCDTSNSPQSIANSVNSLLVDENKLSIYKKNSRSAAENEFNWEIQEKKLLNLYNNVRAEK